MSFLKCQSHPSNVLKWPQKFTAEGGIKDQVLIKAEKKKRERERITDSKAKVKERFEVTKCIRVSKCRK